MRLALAALSTLAAVAGAFANTQLTIGKSTLDFSDPALKPSDDSQKAFAADYLAAARSGDRERMRRLVLPESLACNVSPTARAALDERLTRYVGRNPPADVKVIFAPYADMIGAISEPAPFTLPVAPNALFGLDYEKAERDGDGVLKRLSGVTVAAPALRRDDRYFLVEYCLTPAGEELYRNKKAAPAPK